MSEYLGPKKIKKMWIGTKKVKKVFLGDKKVWSGSSQVTYIINGTSVTEEVDEGENCATRTATVSGATFLGWTTDSTSTTPVSNIPATGEPMTLYGIYKYNDAAASMSNPMGSYQSSATTWNWGLTADGTKYQSLQFANIQAYFGKNGSGYANFNVYFGFPNNYRALGTASQVKPNRNSFSGALTLPIANATSQKLTSYCSPTSSGDYYINNLSNIKLIGRTCVG